MKTMTLLLITAWAAPLAVPAYEKIFRETAPGKIEVKTLPERTALTAEGTNSYFEENNGLFGRLFRFIRHNDVSMTVPVKADIEPGRMVFYLGTGENPEALESVQGVVVVKETEQTVMSIGVRGSYSRDNFIKARDELLGRLESSGQWMRDGDPYAVYWNGPYVPGFLKKFEVHVPVKRKPAAQEG